MRPWLTPVLDALNSLDRPCPVFFRDDDVGWAAPELWALLDVFQQRDIPIDLAVIPTEITADLARALVDHATRSRIRLHQHGFAHSNHEREGRKCEFGSSRDASDQSLDLEAGRRRMVDAFGPLVDPVFTPPWNRCTEVTASQLVEHGLTVLSRDITATPFNRQGLIERPVTVDWCAKRKGVRITRHALGDRIAGSIGSGTPVGIMLHHAVSDDEDREAIADLLDLVDAHPSALPTTIADLTAAPTP